MSAQAVNNQIKDVVMPSANAASLGKFGDIPVGYYTGIPSIGIPIHTVQEGSVSLPIALSYHAGGVKAGEHNSWVGLGWSLSAGGIISRTVQGKADESAFGYFAIGKEIGTNADTCITRNGSSGTTLPDAQFGTEIANGQKDGEPDMFNFSIGGYSGKFYIDVDNTNNSIVDGRVILVPKQDLKVEYVVADNSTSVTKLYKFTITTPDGTKYEFGNNNESLTDIANDAIEITKPFNALCDRYASSWYLKRIISSDALDIISLFYKKENYRYGYRASAGAPSQNTLGSALGGYRAGIMDIIGCRLETITTSSGKESVTFIANVNRNDLDVTPGTSDEQKAKRLSSISIQTGTFCKQFVLTHSYFEDNSAAKSGQYTDFRLKLNSVQEMSCAGADVIKPYVFTYNQQPTNPNYLPNRLTGAVDHWGYFNAATGNPRRGLNIPYTRLIYNNISNNLTDVKEGFSNRETNPNSMKLGTISQIQYPTGGTTAFEYEANTYWDSAGVKKIQDDGDFSLYWIDGGQCSMNNTSSPFYKTFSVIDDMFFAWATKKAHNWCPSPCNCTGNPSNVILKVFQGSGTFALDTKEISCGINDTLVNIRTDKLSYLFPFLQAGINYRFELTGSNSASKFLFQKEVLADPALNNKKVGGLRIKTMTISDGVNIANNTVKTYDYSSSIPSISSGVLYNRPAYAHVFRNTIGHCNELSTAYFVDHLFMENAVVPLSSFEGYHIGYRKVKEYINNSFGTEYNYGIEGPEPFTGFPRAPEPPRIRSGELMSKVQFDAPVRNPVSSETITPYNDPYVTGQGTYIKFNNFTFGASPNTATALEGWQTNHIFPIGNHGWAVFYSTRIYSPTDGLNGSAGSTKVVSFWKKYAIRTRPNRVSETKSIVDGIETITKYTYDAQNRFLAPMETRTINSDGTELINTTYYAANLPSNHPNIGTQQTDMLNKFMIGIPLQTEQRVKKPQTTAVPRMGGSQLVYQGNYPYQAYALNKDTTWQLQMTVEEYITGLPQKIRKPNYLFPQVFSWDAYRRVTNKNYGTLTTVVDYYGSSNLPSMVTDENGLKTKFTYDGLMRLKKTDNRFLGTVESPQDIQATTTYDYHYKNSPTDKNYVGTSSTFKGVTAPLSTKQYVDGLGRATSVVKENYTPNGLNQINDVTYDSLGRQLRSYLPYESGTLQSSAGYVQAAYEASPLSRPISQKNPDGTFTYMSYGTNSAEDAVQVFKPSSVDGMVSSASSSSSYAANTLYKTMATDENGKTACSFKDKFGRVILTRKFLNGSNGQNVDTYNVYDDYGQLVAVLPPGSVIGTGTVSVLNELTFQYKYDKKSRLIEKKIPGADAQRFYYDNRDLLVMSQDGNMAVQGKYLATLYDDLGRVKKTGFSTIAPSLNTEGDCTTTIATAITDRLTETAYYPNKSWVKHQGAKVLKPVGVVTPTDFLWSYTERRFNIISAHKGNPAWMGKQHLRSQGVSTNPILDSDVTGVDWVVSSYNGMQQPNSTIRYVYADNSGDVRTWQHFTYDNGRRLTDVKYNYALNGAGISEPTYTLSNMVYNHKDQLIEKNIGLTGTSALQSIDYTYNIRGWLTNINNVALFTNETTSIMTPPMSGSSPIQNLAITPFINKAVQDAVQPYRATNANELPPLLDDGVNVDLFSQNITYGNPASQTGAAGQNNGNISSTTWQVLGRAKQAYGFTYDGLDRLTEAKYFDITEGYQNGQLNSQYSTDNKFKEAIQYDLRGNILGLQRNGFKYGSWTTNNYTAGEYTQIDNLSYIYNSKNQVTSIIDGAVNFSGLSSTKDYKGFVYNPAEVNVTGGNHYTYDNNGNLITDFHKDIDLIEYNLLNLPQVITFTNGRTIKFVYDASGAKLRKITNDNGVETTYDYINGVEYRNGSLQRFAHTEGAVVRNDYGAFEHNYVLRDHLGNARVTFTDGTNYGDPYSVLYDWYFDWNTFQYFEIHQYIDPNAGNTGLNDGVITAADIKQVNNYYAFGLNMEGNWQGGAQGNNKYQYNEKELNTDFGLGWNDYGARMYDAAVARWTAVDPLAEKFIDNGSYNYVTNRPTIAIDPDGQDVIILFRTGTGDQMQTYSVRYGADGKLYDTKTGNEYASTTKEADAYINDVKSTLDNLKGMGGVVSEVISDLIESKAEHKITNQSTKIKSPISMNVRDGENTANNEKGGTLTLYDPTKDRAAGIKFTSEEVLGHEMRHAYNKQHSINNSGLDVIRKGPMTKTIQGEEVSGVGFQNVIRKYQGYWLYPLKTYNNVDISKKLVVPTLVPQQVPLKNKIVHRSAKN